MKDYTEELKESWESNDLTFVAILSKVQNQSYGFFDNFINLKTKKKLFYPSFDELNVEDKKLSFFWSKAEG